MIENEEYYDIPLSSIFTVGTALLGISTLQIQEIIKVRDITEVPRSPDFILGILNLRGRIVTIFDLGRRLTLGECQTTDDSRIIIVDDKGESVGLKVDQILDVIPIYPGELLPPPANLNSIQGKYFENIHNSADGLVGLLNLEAVLNHQ